jgi:transcriptional regulator with XRE-family HTH domain
VVSPRNWRGQVSKALHSARQAALVRLLIQKREAAGLTQAQLAKRLGQYQSFVARLESGERRIDVVEFLEISEVVGFNARDVILALLKVK